MLIRSLSIVASTTAPAPGEGDAFVDTPICLDDLRAFVKETERWSGASRIDGADGEPLGALTVTDANNRVLTAVRKR
jgi:hypothetical protein